LFAVGSREAFANHSPDIEKGDAMNITVIMKDGRRREFKHEGRPGGSYTKRLRYEPGFVVITDEWGQETAIPAEDISEVRTEPLRGF
jgi:hypothetical protein